MALARALVFEPSVLLLDEPFSALDKNLRGQMQAEMKRLHQETGTTFVFVTHDQCEALALSSRVAIFNHGELLQVGTPQEVYERPANRFVAEFLGEINMLPLKDIRKLNGDAAAAIRGPADHPARTMTGAAANAIARDPARAYVDRARAPQLGLQCHRRRRSKAPPISARRPSYASEDAQRHQADGFDADRSRRRRSRQGNPTSGLTWPADQGFPAA